MPNEAPHRTTAQHARPQSGHRERAAVGELHVKQKTHVKPRITVIALWGLGCVMAAVALIQLLVVTNGAIAWFVPAIGVGVPTAGLLMAFLGLLPGTRPAVKVFVRVLPPGRSGLQAVQAVRIKSKFYRIVSQNMRQESWEFLAGDIVECVERDLPDGQKGLVAILRV